MEFVPLIYFSALAWWIFKRNNKTVDFAFLISCMYALSAFFGVLLINFDLVDVGSVYHGSETPEATFVYCGLLTLCLIPFIRKPSCNIMEISPLRDENLLRTLAWVAAIWFLIIFLFNIGDILYMLAGMSGKLITANKDFVEGYDAFAPMPVFLRWPILIFSYAFSCSWIFIFLAFYSVSIQKLSWSYFRLFTIASLYNPFLGILGQDRSKVTYWIIAVVFCFVLFRPYMEQQVKERMRKLFIMLVPIVVVYLFLMTVSRFGDNANYSVSGVSGGGMGSLIVYLGQPYINFCYFFEYYRDGLGLLSILFPFVSSFILPPELVGGVNIQELFTTVNGTFAGVFYTYLGQIMMAAGFIAVLIYCIIYFVSANVAIRIDKSMSLASTYLYVAFASVMFLGLFVHFYTAPKYTSSLVLSFVFFKFISRR